MEFGTERPTSNTTEYNHEVDEFAAFAQSRTAAGYISDRDAGSTYEDNIKGVPNEGSISDVMCAKGPYPYPTPIGNDGQVGCLHHIHVFNNTFSYEHNILFLNCIK